MPQFLLTRRDDLVVLGVEWTASKFRLDVAASRGPRLIALSNDARISITFPPQTIAEQKMFSNSDVREKSSQRANSSRVSFILAAGASVPLTVEGVLGALTASGTSVTTVMPSGSVAGDEPTAIELPWRIVMSLAPQTSGVKIVSDHAVLPVTSVSKVTGLWHTRLRATDGDAQDARLSLVPLRVLPPGEMDPPTTLSRAQRERIVFLSEQRGLPSARRLELTTLGGSLSASGARSWPDFEWEHDVVLGRDHRVRVLEKGFLYPFGHRAQFLELTQRTFGPLREPEFQPTPGGSPRSGGSHGSGASSGPGGHPPEDPPTIRPTIIRRLPSAAAHRDRRTLL